MRDEGGKESEIVGGDGFRRLDHRQMAAGQQQQRRLRQMIEQELMQNPVLEEIGEDGLPREREASDDAR